VLLYIIIIIIIIFIIILCCCCLYTPYSIRRFIKCINGLYLSYDVVVSFHCENNDLIDFICRSISSIVQRCYTYVFESVLFYIILLLPVSHSNRMTILLLLFLLYTESICESICISLVVFDIS
jgi:hypothetical protein